MEQEKDVPMKEEPKKKVSKKKKNPKPQQVVPAKPPKKVSFDVWARKRNVKEHHKGGLRAFVKNPDKPRSFDQWDKAFESY